MAALFVLLIAAFFMFIFPLLGVLFGAFSGWVVGLVFGDWLLVTLSALVGYEIPVSMAALGALLGFIGGFLKTNVTSTSK